jgi:hypothetical protein
MQRLRVSLVEACLQLSLDVLAEPVGQLQPRNLKLSGADKPTLWTDSHCSAPNVGQQRFDHSLDLTPADTKGLPALFARLHAQSAKRGNVSRREIRVHLVTQQRENLNPARRAGRDLYAPAHLGGNSRNLTWAQ